ncbi:MAG: hypothetical protein NUV69_03650 [Candidatus Curtissbacteria bacterium]|nr:hypothetical protein [Candidatus Curtissbacteria bacterium]
MLRVLLLISLVIIIGGSIFAFIHFKSSSDKTQTDSVVDKVKDLIPSGSEAEKRGKSLSNGHCEGMEKPKLGTLPMNYDDFSMIIPYGAVIGDHVIPIDHQYFSPTIFRSPRDTYEVRAMADAKLVAVEPRKKPDYTEYRMVFSMSCRLFYYYDLVTSLSPDIQKVTGDPDDKSYKRDVNIPVKEGQLIGRIGGQTLDFAVWDTEKVLSGFLDPKQYEAERWKIHTVDPLDYYTEKLKNQALSKYLRTIEPRSGKIDYDIDGRLIGNWFLEGSKGYEGTKSISLENYSQTHLAIIPDHLDPATYIASFGNYGGLFKQLVIVSPQIDPKDVSMESGLVKYGLDEYNFETPDGEMWTGITFAQNLRVRLRGTTHACVLYQLIEKRKLKMEAFPSTPCSKVLSFTSEAKMYYR